MLCVIFAFQEITTCLVVQKFHLKVPGFSFYYILMVFFKLFYNISERS